MMIRSVLACTFVAVSTTACGGASRAALTPEEFVGCYEISAEEAGPGAAAIPGFRLFLEGAASGAAGAYRAGTILANGREGVYPFNQWTLSDGELIVRSTGQSGAILTLSPGAGPMSGTISYYSDVAGTAVPDRDVESRKVACE